MNPVLFFDDERCEAHVQAPGHPESPERIRAVRDGLLSDQGLKPWLKRTKAREALAEELLRFHTQAYLDEAQAACMGGEGSFLATDVLVGPGSWEAALLAAGGACDAVTRVLAGEAPAAFCNLRPPGHHARAFQAMGFCILNNPVLAAHKALAAGVRRVALVDWDVHHGNGSQEAFARDGRVFYASLHRSPFYPGTGLASEKGGGPGAGRILNVPLPAATPAEDWRKAWEAQVLPALRGFQPEFILVSAGFDAHRDDPIGGLELDAPFFGRLTQDLLGLARESRCRGVVSLLEGGYDLPALAASAKAHVRALAGLSPR